MDSATKSLADQPSTEEGEIFKSLTHEIRRNIIKALGMKDQSSFTDIKNAIGDIDNPTLSYHLKSLKHLINQKSDHYFLTDIGRVALLLMDRIDQSKRLRKGKKTFLYANIITIVCWTLVAFLIPNLIALFISVSLLIIIIIVINVVIQINSFLIWRLWGTTGWRRA